MAVTVARFATPHEAHLAKLRLESEGIVAFVADENVNRIQPLLGPALGWIRLQVADEDVDAARHVLTTDDPGAEAALARLGPEHLGGRSIRPPARGRPLTRALGRGLVWVLLALVIFSVLRSVLG
jgi:Putative prokaryotic signal transducing protein